MKKLIGVLCFVSTVCSAQAIYDANGQYIGKTQSSGNETNFYDQNGQYKGKAIQSDTSTTFYGQNGQYKGNYQAPFPPMNQVNPIQQPRGYQ